MTLKETLKELEALGEEKVRKHNKKWGAGENQFGVKLGELRKLAKKIKLNQELALELWETENVDARFLAILLMNPNLLTTEQLEHLVYTMKFTRVADWLNSYVLNKHPENEELRLKWLNSDNTMMARCAWSLTAERINKNPDGLDLAAILGRIEKEMGLAEPEVQWTMNFALAYVGINFPELRKRAIDIGEKLGIYSDYPVSKGCTSPFAPIWINEMVSRQNKS